jgi:hypothetical protein
MKVPYLISLSFLFTVFVFGTSYGQVDKNRNPVLGSWELVKYIDHGNNEKDWQSYDSNIVYQKHITDSHFTWVKYDKENDQLLGLGGGTYTIDNTGRYIENIQFFYPPGSSELGQSIPFEMYVNKNTWLHTGYAKNMEFAADGEMVVTDPTKIEEEWKKIKDVSNKSELLGTWDLISYREQEKGSMIEYPEFIVYMKLITPTHFIWIKYDNEGDQIYAAGSGPYTYDGNNYVESLVVTYPQGSSINGINITFTPNVNSNKWIHQKTMELEDAEVLFIDEIWTPKAATISEVTDFIE